MAKSSPWFIPLQMLFDIPGIPWKAINLQRMGHGSNYLALSSLPGWNWTQWYIRSAFGSLDTAEPNDRIPWISPLADRVRRRCPKMEKCSCCSLRYSLRFGWNHFTRQIQHKLICMVMIRYMRLKSSSICSLYFQIIGAPWLGTLGMYAVRFPHISPVEFFAERCPMLGLLFLTFFFGKVEWD